MYLMPPIFTGGTGRGSGRLCAVDISCQFLRKSHGKTPSVSWDWAQGSGLPLVPGERPRQARAQASAHGWVHSVSVLEAAGTARFRFLPLEKRTLELRFFPVLTDKASRNSALGSGDTPIVPACGICLWGPWERSSCFLLGSSSELKAAQVSYTDFQRFLNRGEYQTRNIVK